MKPRRNSTIVWWVSALVVIAVGVGLLWPGKPGRSSPLITESHPKAATPAPVAAQPAPLPTSTVTTPAPEPPPVAPKKPTEAELQAIIVKTAVEGRVSGEVRMPLYRAGLQLTPEEYDRFVARVIDFSHARAQVEKALLKVTSFDGTTLTLQIPPYPDQGIGLKAAFLKQIAQDFPAATAQAIERGLDGALNPTFGGFGRFAQTRVVTANPENIHIRFYASVAGDVQTTDSATLEEILQLSGDESLSRDGLPLFHEAIADVINAHFPVK